MGKYHIDQDKMIQHFDGVAIDVRLASVMAKREKKTMDEIIDEWVQMKKDMDSGKRIPGMAWPNGRPPV